MSKSSTPKSTPQAGSLSNPPNLVGKRFSPDEFNGRFVITAAIQKIVNLPAILAAENFVNSKDKLEFRLTLTANTTGDGIVTNSCKTPQILASFTPENIKKARGSGQYEVTFSKEDQQQNNNNNNLPKTENGVLPAIPHLQSNQQNPAPAASSANTWIIQAEGRNQLIGKCSMKIQLQEMINGAPYRVLFDQTTQVVLQKVLDRKVLVFLYGSAIGRIGVTLSVSPEDNQGYKKRMDRFLAQFSASPDPQVASSIMSKCDEITTFAYLWKRYGIVDYSARLRRFLALYSRHLVGQEDTLLSKYKMHEEEMFMSLVLDNGPEELDIDAKRRLEAFKTKYFITNLDVEKEAARGFSDFLGYMDKMSEQYGAEPDPRTYLFPEPNYKPPPGIAKELTPTATPPPPSQSNNNNNAPGSKSPEKQQLGAAAAGRSGSSSPQTQTSAAVLQNQMPNSPAAKALQQQVQNFNNNNNSNSQQPPNFATANGRTTSIPPGGSSSPNFGASSGSSPLLKPQNSTANTNNSNALGAGTSSSPSSGPPSGYLPPSSVDLWSNFIGALAAKRVSSSDIFFLSDDAFVSLMSQVGVNQSHRHLVMSEWKRRAAENLQLTHFAPTDPSFEAVRSELLSLTGMQPINLSVLGVVGLRNSEHEATHSTRLGLMSDVAKTVERCVYAGEYNTLLRCAERGITAVMSATDSGLCFPRRPFAPLEKPTAISVMICDVIAGYQTNAVTVKEAMMARSDTVAVSGNGNPADAGIFVRDVRHVLPRFIIHCHVDPTLVPCPLHPHKQVEFYVVETQTFACSNCVVLGPHVGKPIVTLDEALQWARTQLNEILKDANTVHQSASEIDRDMAEQLNSITGENARRKKEELIESIRREAELRAQDAAKQLEAEMAMQADILQAQRQRIAPLKTSLTQTTSQLQNTVRQGNVAKSLEVLQAMSSIYDPNESRQRVNEVKHSLSLMPQLTTAQYHKNAWVLASGGAINGGGAGFNHQQQQYRSRSASQPNQQQHHQDHALYGNSGYSRFMDAANTMANTRANSRGQTPSQHNISHLQHQNLSSADNSLYNKFVNANHHHNNNTNNNSSRFNNNAAAAAVSGGGGGGSSPSGAMPSPGGQSTASTRMDMLMMNNSNNNNSSQQQQGRDLLQDGWKAFRRGDANTARSLWLTATERYPNTAVGARANAYIAEALDKDAPKAAESYERALQCDPTDCMTLFNYGVLLEATGHTLRALQLFEAAQRLGDIASGKRARVIRQQQLASNDH